MSILLGETSPITRQQSTFRRQSFGNNNTEIMQQPAVVKSSAEILRKFQAKYQSCDLGVLDEDDARIVGSQLHQLYRRLSMAQSNNRVKEKEYSSEQDVTEVSKPATSNITENKQKVFSADDHVEASKTESSGMKNQWNPDWTPFEKLFAKDLLPAEDSEEETSKFLQELVDLLQDYIRKNNDRSTKVLDFHQPHALLEEMDHCLDLPSEGQPLEQILSDCKETLKYCVRTGHPRFFNQLSTGLDIIAVAGEWLTAVANTNMFTYEIAPVFTVMEHLLLKKMRQTIGWSTGDGIFAAGGSMCNMYAILASRYKAVPQVREVGLQRNNQNPIVLFVSEHAHYSFKKAAAVTGIGTDNVIPVATNDAGKMDPVILEQEVEKAKESGRLPFLAVATGGTTVLGAFDPIPEIRKVCDRHGMWLHVDTAWGGGVLLSKKYKYLLTGIENADSVTWNPHKMMGVTLQCSAFLTRNSKVLMECNRMCADYLFQQDKNYDVSWDTGDKSIQCGRRNDAFKLWLMWRAKGDEGFENQINWIFENASYLRSLLKDRPGFEMVIKSEHECTNTCFWYYPIWMRRLSKSEQRLKVGKIAPIIKKEMMEKGSTMIGYQPLGSLPNFFRMVFSNPATKKEDVEFLVSEIEKLGEEIAPF